MENAFSGTENNFSFSVKETYLMVHLVPALLWWWFFINSNHSHLKEVKNTSCNFIFHICGNINLSFITGCKEKNKEKKA